MNNKIVKVNYLDKNQSNELVYLLNEYAKDPMGGGKALPAKTINNIASELSKLPHAFSLIGYIDDEPVGLVNCFEAFSTFSCKPLINIHDLVVLKHFRGSGISQRLLEKVEEIAISKGCCKLTLEVLATMKRQNLRIQNLVLQIISLTLQLGAPYFGKNR